MARGICLAIGLNDFDRNSPAYQGVQADALQGCVNDANAVAGLIESLGTFDQTTVLTFDPSNPSTNDAPTYDKVKSLIADAASKLEPGGLFVLHYSGHGMQGTVDAAGNVNPDNTDGSSWILYDRPLSSDDLFQSWAAFKPGVRILVFSDSCHSGTAIKDFVLESRGIGIYHAPKQFDRADRLKVLQNLAARFPKTVIHKSITKKSAEDVPNATLLLISGCQESQESLDSESGGVPGGLFTTTLVNVWAKGGFTGDYNDFYNQVAQQTHDASVNIDASNPQDPNFFAIGNADDFAIFAGMTPLFSF